MDYKSCCKQCHWLGLDNNKEILGCYVSGERQAIKDNGNIDDNCHNFYDHNIEVDNRCDAAIPWEV